MMIIIEEQGQGLVGCPSITTEASSYVIFLLISSLNQAIGVSSRSSRRVDEVVVIPGGGCLGSRWQVPRILFAPHPISSPH